MELLDRIQHDAWEPFESTIQVIYYNATLQNVSEVLQPNYIVHY